MEENKTELKGNAEVEPEVAEAAEETAEEKPSKKGEKSEIKKLKASLALAEENARKLEASLADSQDKYLRMMAEYDNFRKRSQKEREGIYGEALADAVASLLPILDNLGRASGYTDAAAVTEGLEMILKSADEALAKLGVEAFGEAGESFDPNLHNAVMHTEDPELAENVITDVFQRGYKRGDRVIRYAMVKVAN